MVIRTHSLQLNHREVMDKVMDTAMAMDMVMGRGKICIKMGLKEYSISL